MTGDTPAVDARLDRLSLELRSLPGVVAVGFSDEGASVVVQVVVSAEASGSEARTRIRRTTRASLERPPVLEVVVEPSIQPPFAVQGPGDGAPDLVVAAQGLGPLGGVVDDRRRVAGRRAAREPSTARARRRRRRRRSSGTQRRT